MHRQLPQLLLMSCWGFYYHKKIKKGDNIMNFFNKLREPIVLKEESDALKQLEQLEICLQNAPENLKAQIEQEKKRLTYGIKGEQAILFELKNSHLPMYILHDLFFKEGDLKTQIDYIVITRKIVLVIECKNLYGNISIDNQGNFTRTIQIGNQDYYEGIYSPITQNQRHLDMIREKRRASKGFFEKYLFDKNFNESYKSCVVIANPKTIIKMKYAPKELKSQIVKIDGLNSYIKTLNNSSTNGDLTDKQMKALADFFLENSVPNETDYTEKYRTTDMQKQNITEVVNTNTETINNDTSSHLKIDTLSTPTYEVEKTPLYIALKDYRYQQSKKEMIKAYYIYNNAQLEELIRKKPLSLEELHNISGFGEAKCTKYGNDILNIIKKYS